MTKIDETSVRDCPVEGCEWPNNGSSGPKYDCGLRRMAALGAQVSVARSRELGCGYVKASMWPGVAMSTDGRSASREDQP